MSKIKSRWLKILVFIITLSLVAFGAFQVRKVLRSAPKQEKNIPFSWVPIVSFCAGNLPCVQIEIEGQKFVAMLDLGFNGQLTLSNEFMSKISDKTFLFTSPTKNWTGKEYQLSYYRIPEFQLGNATFSNAELGEEDPNEEQDTIIDKPKEKADYLPANGKLGWKLFKKLALFMDFKHGLVAICDSVDTFAQYGYRLEKFVQAPVLLNAGIVEVNALTSEGPLRFFLDTGCTNNCWNEDYPVEEVRERMENAKYFKTFSNVSIGGKDFGKMIFRPLPMNFPMPMQAILGMDFFFEHQVLIDFKNEQIYIAVSQEEDKPDGAKTKSR
jgi:hypothetical protein